jgi:hypothetical protein
MKKILVIIFSFIICALSTTAQNDSISQISTDRPTQSVSPYLVPKGSLQIESGVVYTNREDEESILEMWSIANTLLRYGIYEHFEVRLAGSFENNTLEVKNSEIDSSYNGLGPISAGFKVFIVEEKGIRPEIAIVGSITFRHIGSDYFTPTFSYPVGLLALNHNITNKFSLGYNLGFAYNGEDADGFFIYTGMLGYKISDRFWCFAEVYGNFDNGNFPNHRANAGFTYLVRNNLQLDISGGIGISNHVNRDFLSAGLSWRIPK